MAYNAAPRRARVIITEHVIGPRDVRVMNRDLPQDHEEQGLAPRLHKYDACEMDAGVAAEIVHSGRAIHVPEDRDAAEKLLRTMDAARDAEAAEAEAAAAPKGRKAAAPAADQSGA